MIFFKTLMAHHTLTSSTIGENLAAKAENLYNPENYVNRSLNLYIDTMYDETELFDLHR